MLSLTAEERNSFALTSKQSPMHLQTRGNKSSLRETVAYLEKENASLRNNLMEVKDM